MKDFRNTEKVKDIRNTEKVTAFAKELSKLMREYGIEGIKGGDISSDGDKLSSTGVLYKLVEDKCRPDYSMHLLLLTEDGRSIRKVLDYNVNGCKIAFETESFKGVTNKYSVDNIETLRECGQVLCTSRETAEDIYNTYVDETVKEMEEQFNQARSELIETKFGVVG